MAILTYIDSIPLFSSKQEALSWGITKSLKGYHTHSYDGVNGFMAGWSHKSLSRSMKLTLRQQRVTRLDPNVSKSTNKTLVVSSKLSNIDQVITNLTVTEENYQYAEDLVNDKILDLKEAINKADIEINRIKKEISKTRDKNLIEALKLGSDSVLYQKTLLARQYAQIESKDVVSAVDYITREITELQRPGSDSEYIEDVESAVRTIVTSESFSVSESSKDYVKPSLNDKQKIAEKDAKKVVVEKAVLKKPKRVIDPRARRTYSSGY